jgi:cytochrome c biogenesis protein
MKSRDSSVGPFKRVWKFFTSVKLTVVLLLTLAATSIIGTLIEQNRSPADYLQAFGEPLYRLFSMLDLFNMYHSWWFRLLLLLLTANIIVCSIDRLKSTWKIIFVKNPSFNLARFQSLKNRIETNDPRSRDQLEQVARRELAKRYSYHRLDHTDNGFALFAEKWRWTRLGVYVVHSSVVLLLIGGLLGSIFGFDGFVNIPEGESTSTVRLQSNSGAVELSFEIRCEDFDISFYPSGMPREYRSTLTIVEGGKPVLTQDIIVNDPLRYKGINIFQSSYGELPARQTAPSDLESITLGFTSKETGMIYEKTARIGGTIDIPEGLGRLTLNRFEASHNFMGRDLGAALIGTLVQKDGSSVEVVLPLRFPSFDRMGPMFNSQRKDDVLISIVDYKSVSGSAEKRYYTGLQVTKDPGVWIVYAGFSFMIIGCMITFFMSHQRICIEVNCGGGPCRIAVSGTANKNKLGMQRKLEKLMQKISRAPTP